MPSQVSSPLTGEHLIASLSIWAKPAAPQPSTIIGLNECPLYVSGRALILAVSMARVVRAVHHFLICGFTTLDD